jgi:hypothetical protein
MLTRKRLLSATLVLSLLWAGHQAEAKEKKWKGSFSGSYISTEVDTDNNGEKGAVGTLRGASNLGAFSEQVITETDFNGGSDVTCPSGNLGRQFSLVPGTGHFVLRFDAGDLVWGTITSEILCFDYTTGIFSFEGQTAITGGTGKYQNVTGAGQFSGESKHLFAHPYPAEVTSRVFDEENGTFEATINIP